VIRTYTSVVVLGLEGQVLGLGLEAQVLVNNTDLHWRCTCELNERGTRSSDWRCGDNVLEFSTKNAAFKICIFIAKNSLAHTHTHTCTYTMK